MPRHNGTHWCVRMVCINCGRVLKVSNTTSRLRVKCKECNGQMVVKGDV